MEVSYCQRGTVFVILLLLILGCTHAENNCKRGCTKSESGFLKYAAGSVYEYNYESIMTVTVGSGSVSSEENNDDTSIKISGNAKFFAEGNCGFVLQLSGIKVTALKDGAIDKQLQHNIAKPVHFTLSADGFVEPEICTDSSDDIFSLNIKRAIISMLQTNKENENKNEVDVFGQCPTHTSTTMLGNTEIVTKMRNLNSCTYREHVISGIVNGVVNEHAGVKSSVLLQADYMKDAKVENGIVQSVQLTEHYHFIGTHKSSSDIKAKVVTDMKLKTTGTAPAAPVVGDKYSKSNIIFQKPNHHTAKNIQSLKDIITQISQTNNDYVHKGSATQFGELVRLMRSSDADTLLELASVPFLNKALSRKVYLDALFRTATSESARVIIKQFGKFNDLEKTLGMLSLSLVQVVDKETINQAAVLVSPAAPKEVFLAVGSLIKRYCKQQNCENAPEVQNISKKFVESLKHCKANTKKDEERIVYTLKGIANANGLPKSILPSLTECSSAGRSTRIRVSALQAFSAAGCENGARQHMVRLLKDYNEDSELRIEAYLAAVVCPTAELANELAELLQNEKVNQVGGFISSHLRSIRDSTDDHRAHLRHYLGNIRISQQFPHDIRRFSYNNELSYRWDALGLSSSADYKLVYSQNGFLPRSARLNITSELFGMNFNVLEANLRQENLENVLEYYFGPKGLINKDFDEIMKTNGGSRARRSIADESAKFAKKYKTLGRKNQDDLNWDLSLKLFGSGMFFLSLGDYIPTTLDDLIRVSSAGFDEFKKEVTDLKKEFSMHSVFLDTEIMYPTAVGMPFEVNLQGLAASKFDLKLSVDIDAIIGQNWQRAKYNLKIVPSVDVNVNLRLGFNAYVLSSGLRVSSSLHSAVGSDITLAFINDNGFTMDIQLPREKLDLVDLQTISEFYIAEQDKPIKTASIKGIQPPNAEKNNEKCFDHLKSMGLTHCLYSTISSNEDGRLLNWLHPQQIGLYLKNEGNYHIKGYHEPKTATGTKKWTLDFSTPGSKESHDIALALELGVDPRFFSRLSLDSPQNHLVVEAGINNDDKELVAYSKYEKNDQINTNRIGFEKYGNEYRPIIAIQGKNGEQINNINGYRADGRIIFQKMDDKSARYNFDNFQLIDSIHNQQLVINGWAEVSATKSKSELKVRYADKVYNVKGGYTIENGLYEAQTFIADEKMPVNEMGGSVQVRLTEQTVGVNVEGKAYMWDAIFRFNMENKAGDETSSGKIQSELSLKHKGQNFGSLTVNGNFLGHNKFNVDVALSNGKHTVSVTTKFQSNRKSENDYDLEVNGKFNKNFVKLIAKCEVRGNQFTVDNLLTTSWGTTISAKGQLGQRYTPQDILIDLSGTVQLKTKNKPIQWVLKVNGSPEKTTSEFMLNRENQELLKYNGESIHHQDKALSAKGNLNIKDIMGAKIEFKVGKNGKGDFNIHADIFKAKEKHEVEVTSKFHIQAPKYEMETSIELDKKMKMNFKTETHIDKTKLITKNLAEVGEDRTVFELSTQMKGTDWKANSETSGSFKLKLPIGHSYDGSFARKITTNPKNGQSQGHIDIEVNGLQFGEKHSFSYNSKLEKLNLKTKDIAMTSTISYNCADRDHLKVDFHVNHTPVGAGKYKVDVKIAAEGKGAILLKPSEVTFLVSEYDERHASVVLTAKFDGANQINVNGNYKIDRDRGKALQYDLQAGLVIPKFEFKSFKLTGNGKYVLPENQGGVYILESQLNSEVGSGQFVKFHTSINGNRQQGSYMIDIQSNNMASPLKIDGSYQHDQQQASNSRNFNSIFSTGLTYGQKDIKTSWDVKQNDGTLTVHYILKSSFESVKALDLTLQSEKLANESHSVKSKMMLNNQQYMLTTIIFHSMHRKGLDINVKTPQSSEDIKFVGVAEIMGQGRGKVKGEVANLAGLDLTYNIEASFEDLENFYIIGSWNSKRLHLNNYAIDLKSVNKSIELSIKNAEGIIVSGNVAYIFKKEGSKALIEGQGQVQYNGKSQNTNFKLIRQMYDISTDKEVGFSYTFNGNFGPKNAVSMLKITNKDMNLKFSVCEEKKQCNNVQIQSIISSLPGSGSDISSSLLEFSQHTLLVVVDFRELGYPYEFELQSKTIRQGLILKYSLDSNIISNKNLKYQFVINMVPKSSKIQIRLPSREIQFESVTEYPDSGFLGKYRHATEFSFDKIRKPSDVTKFESTLHISSVENGLSTNGEIRFQHPKMRPLSINGKVDINREQQVMNAEMNIDIFKKPEQKIFILSQMQYLKRGRDFNVTTIQKLTSSAFDLHYEMNGYTSYSLDRHELSISGDVQTGIADWNSNVWLFANLNRFEMNVKALNRQIIEVNGDLNRQTSNAKLRGKFQIFSQSPLQLSTECRPGFARVELRQEGLSNGNAEIQLGKELKFQAEGKAGGLLVDGKIMLDASNFLETTFSADEKNLNEFADVLKLEVEKQSKLNYENIKEKIQKLQEHVDKQIQLSKDSLPDLKGVASNYNQHIKEIIDELEQDPSLKEIIDSHREVFEKLAHIVENVNTTLMEAFDQIQNSLSSILEKMKAIMKDTAIPLLEEFLQTSERMLRNIGVASGKLLAEQLQFMGNVIKKYVPVLRNYNKAIQEFVKPYLEVIEDLDKVLEEAIGSIYSEIKEWIAQLPTFEEILTETKAKFDEIRLREKALELLNFIFDHLKGLPMTPEAADVLQTLYKYLGAKLNGENISDSESITKIIKLAIKALRSLWSTIEFTFPFTASEVGSNKFPRVFGTLSSYVDNIVDFWPGLLSLRLSALNFVINEDWISKFTQDNIKSIDYLHDFNLHGHVADGRHIFTYDGLYYTFNGNCKYILAQDSRDNNFTVVVQLNNKKLKSIVLSDRDGNYLEVNDGSLKFNGNGAEFPLHDHGGMHAWRKYHTVWLLSEYGVQVMCTLDLKMCHVDVNGFYTGKVRGLLGNGNSEPFDDFIQADGTIAVGAASFANGYGLGKCAPVAEEQKTAKSPQSEICNEIFGLESPLAFSFWLKNYRSFRDACDNAVSESPEKEKENAACNIALTYASALAMESKYSLLPARCLKCQGSAAQRDLYQDFTVKIPNNKADVVFVVDVDIEPTVMNKLVAPTITELRESLKARGFTDVQIGVIAYNETQKYPALLTSDNGKLNYNGNLATLNLNGPKNFCDGCLSQVITEKYLLEIYESFERFLKGILPQSDELAFELALNFPFRAGAAKSIIDVRSGYLYYGDMLKWVRAHIAEAVIKLDGTVLHLITPVKEISLEGVAPEKLIGFNSRLVATLDGKDAKKRQKLQYKSDMGIDFVLNSGGWVFATQNFENLKANDQKKALNQVTNSIADTMFKTEIVSECKCLPAVNRLHAQHVCVVKSSTFVPNKKIKT